MAYKGPSSQHRGVFTSSPWLTFWTLQRWVKTQVGPSSAAGWSALLCDLGFPSLSAVIILTLIQNSRSSWSLWTLHTCIHHFLSFLQHLALSLCPSSSPALCTNTAMLLRADLCAGSYSPLSTLAPARCQQNLVEGSVTLRGWVLGPCLVQGTVRAHGSTVDWQSVGRRLWSSLRCWSLQCPPREASGWWAPQPRSLCSQAGSAFPRVTPKPPNPHRCLPSPPFQSPPGQEPLHLLLGASGLILCSSGPWGIIISVSV